MAEQIQVIDEDSVARAAVGSRQPRFSDTQSETGMLWRRMLDRWTKDTLINVPDYVPDSRMLDAWLNNFWRTESLLAGVISSVVGIDKNRGWTLTGAQEQVSRFQSILRYAEDGAGWRRYINLQSESFWTTNMGGISEIGRMDNSNGPMGALYHVDPTKCVLTGKPTTPLNYFPDKGKEQNWRRNDFMRTVSMPNVQEQYNQLGFCGVMRALQFAVLMVAIYQHDKEMLFATIPKGLLLMSGIDEIDWGNAMKSNEAMLTAKEREFYAGLSVFFSGAGGTLDAKLVPLSQLPNNFNIREWSNVLMYGYALCFGYDPREFWPVSGGTLGTGAESNIQALKASAKGGLDFALAYQDNLQQELPPTLLFQFDQRDETGEQAAYFAIKSYADAVNAMAMPAMVGGEETLTIAERRSLYAEHGYIPDEWTEADENVTATAAQPVERDRLLSSPQVLRACRQFPNEPIIKCDWNWRTGSVATVLWNSGAEALMAPVTYSFPGKKRVTVIEPEEVFYESDDFNITGKDVIRALKSWDSRHDSEWAGLPNAETVEDEQ